MIMFTCFQDITKQKSPFCLWCPSPLTFIFWSLIPNQLRGENPCLRFPKRGRWNVFVFWFSDVEVIESRLRGKHNYCICLKASGLTTFSMHSESDSDQSWQKKIRTEIETPFYPKRQPFNIIRLFCSNWVAMFSSDCRLWTKLKESKYEIANSVTICWNRVFSKFRFFACFKPNVTLLEIKVGLTCCSISLLPLSWPFPVRNIVQWKCWCWCWHFW